VSGLRFEPVTSLTQPRSVTVSASSLGEIRHRLPLRDVVKWQKGSFNLDPISPSTSSQINLEKLTGTLCSNKAPGGTNCFTLQSSDKLAPWQKPTMQINFHGSHCTKLVINIIAIGLFSMSARKQERHKAVKAGSEVVLLWYYVHITQWVSWIALPRNKLILTAGPSWRAERPTLPPRAHSQNKTEKKKLMKFPQFPQSCHIKLPNVTAGEKPPTETSTQRNAQCNTRVLSQILTKS
jgi:hypothetical protein